MGLQLFLNYTSLAERASVLESKNTMQNNSNKLEMRSGKRGVTGASVILEISLVGGLVQQVQMTRCCFHVDEQDEPID